MPIPPQLIALALILVFAVIAWYGFSAQRLLVVIGITLAPFLILLVNNLPLWFVITLGIRNSGLIFPGIPKGLHVVHVMMAGFATLMFARNIIQKPPRQRIQASSLFLLAFLGVLGMTIYFRGIGLRALGGEAWGGMEYVKILISAAFLIFSRHIALSPHHLKLAIVLILLLAFLPATSQILFLLSRGALYHQYYLIDANAGALLGSLQALETGTGVVRFHLLRGVSLHLMMASIVFLRFRGAKAFLLVALIMVALALAGMSGFRIAILAIVGILGIYILLQSPGRRLLRIAQFGSAGILGLLLLIPLVSFLPTSIQRALSFLPFLDISSVAKAHASSSTLWRLEVWRLAWAEIPNYLWLGKGFSIRPSDLSAFSVRADSILSAFLAHNYHSGPITLLLDLGVLGFIAFTGFYLTSSLEMLKRLPHVRSNPNLPPFLKRYYALMLASYVYSFASFYLIYGDPGNIANAFIQLAVLQAVYRGTFYIAPAHDASQSPPPSRYSLRPM